MRRGSWWAGLIGSVIAGAGIAGTEATPTEITTRGFSEQRTLGDGRTIRVSEGEGEPRSIGSYAVHLYATGNPDFPFDDFLAGAVFARDGAIERLVLEDVVGDSALELVVVVRSAGSGGYLSADAISLEADGIHRVGHTEGLVSGADPVEALRR
jgi:hypothetical protein